MLIELPLLVLAGLLLLAAMGGAGSLFILSALVVGRREHEASPGRRPV